MGATCCLDVPWPRPIWGASEGDKKKSTSRTLRRATVLIVGVVVAGGLLPARAGWAHGAPSIGVHDYGALRYTASAALKNPLDTDPNTVYTGATVLHESDAGHKVYIQALMGMPPYGSPPAKWKMSLKRHLNNQFASRTGDTNVPLNDCGYWEDEAELNKSHDVQDGNDREAEAYAQINN